MELRIKLVIIDTSDSWTVDAERTLLMDFSFSCFDDFFDPNMLNEERDLDIGLVFGRGFLFSSSVTILDDRFLLYFVASFTSISLKFSNGLDAVASIASIACLESKSLDPFLSFAISSSSISSGSPLLLLVVSPRLSTNGAKNSPSLDWFKILGG